MNKQEAKKLEQKILKTLNLFLKNGDTIIAGISGGADSVFLLEIIKKLPLNIIIAHVNHSLRGAESKKDAEFVKKISTGHIFKSKTIDLKKLSNNLKKGLEESGRISRYKFFNDLAQKHNANFILTAHHADDNLETILLNFARGATLKGLSGMKMTEKNLLRPLLNISKQEIQKYLKHHKITYREDQSNKDTKFSRNYIRHKIVPHLKKLNPKITEVVAKNSEILKKSAEFIEVKSQEQLEKMIILKKTDTFELNGKKFRKTAQALQEQVLKICYKTIIGNTKNLESKHLEEILTLIGKNIGNKSKKFGQCEISLKNNIIRLKKSGKK